MRAVAAARIGVVAAFLVACGPTFNWREASVPSTSLVALFPCKPQAASRAVALGGKDVELRIASCETGGITLAVGHARLAEGTSAGPVLAQWRAATLAAMHASSSSEAPLRLERADPLPEPVLVNAVGTQADKRAVALRGAWFARGADVFAALMYADAPNAEVGETFFSGLRFR